MKAVSKLLDHNKTDENKLPPTKKPGNDKKLDEKPSRDDKKEPVTTLKNDNRGKGSSTKEQQSTISHILLNESGLTQPNKGLAS